MGYEIKYFFHPRKEEGGYNIDSKEEKTTKVGKPFDDTPLEKCAGVIMGLLARRDIWVVEVEVAELVKKKISFKECADGKGIVLKNKRFSINSTAQMVAEDVEEENPLANLPPGVQPHEVIPMAPAMQPHEALAAARNIESLYSDPNRSSVIVRQQPTGPINQKKVLYEVYYDPELVYLGEAEKLKLKFKPDKKYPVHAVVPHPSGKIHMQKIVVTDDTGKPITVDEKFFVNAGRGLLADAQLGFSGAHKRDEPRSKLMYDNAPIVKGSPRKLSREDLPEHLRNIPIEGEEGIPDEYFQVPEIRR